MGVERGHRALIQVDWGILLHCQKEMRLEDFQQTFKRQSKDCEEAGLFFFPKELDGYSDSTVANPGAESLSNNRIQSQTPHISQA